MARRHYRLRHQEGIRREDSVGERPCFEQLRSRHEQWVPGCLAKPRAEACENI